MKVSYKKYIYLIISLLLVIVISAVTISNQVKLFTNNLESENISLDGSRNVTRFIQFPFANIVNITLTINTTLAKPLDVAGTNYSWSFNNSNLEDSVSGLVMQNIRMNFSNGTGKFDDAFFGDSEVSDNSMNFTRQIIQSDNFTIGGWFKVKNVSDSNSGTLFFQQHTAAASIQPAIFIRTRFGQPYINVVSGVDMSFTGNCTLQNDTFFSYYVTSNAITANSNSYRIYIDGNECGNQTDPNNNHFTNDQGYTYIGIQSGSNFATVPLKNVTFDEIKYWNRTLNHSEIRDQYNAPNTLRIDIGDQDESYEFNNSLVGTEVINLNGTSLNSVISSACTCDNCTVSGEYCIAPIVFSTSRLVNFTYSNFSFYYEAGLDSCISYSAVALNFSVFEENNRTVLNTSVEGVATFRLGDDEESNLTFNYTDVSDFAICITPNSTTLDTDVYLQYKSSGAILERYYIDNVTLSNSTQQVNIYNFASSAGLSTLKANVLTYYNSPYEDVLIKLQRYYPILNSWLTVQVDKSDQFGQGLFYVYQNDVDYRFIWEQNNQQLDAQPGGGSTTPLKFICDTSTDCEETFSIAQEDEENRLSGLSTTANYNNVTGIILFSWSDTNGVATSMRLLVIQEKANRPITICDTTTASSSGTISCNISGYDGIISVRGYATASPASPIYVDIINIAKTQLSDILNAQGYQNDGILFGAFIMMAVAGFGSVSAAASIFLGVAGLIFLFLFKLVSFISLAFVVGGVALGLFVAYMVNK